MWWVWGSFTPAAAPARWWGGAAGEPHTSELQYVDQPPGHRAAAVSRLLSNLMQTFPATNPDLEPRKEQNSEQRGPT